MSPPSRSKALGRSWPKQDGNLDSCSKTFALLPQNVGRGCLAVALSTASPQGLWVWLLVSMGQHLLWFSIIGWGFFFSFLVLMSMGVNLMMDQDFRTAGFHWHVLSKIYLMENLTFYVTNWLWVCQVTLVAARITTSVVGRHLTVVVFDPPVFNDSQLIRQRPAVRRTSERCLMLCYHFSPFSCPAACLPKHQNITTALDWENESSLIEFSVKNCQDL